MKVFVYGATGYAGRLLARALVDRGDSVVVAGRDRSRLTALAAELGDVKLHAVPVHEPARLRDAMQGADVVVSCAGPFSVMGEPVIHAAIDVGAHYLDIASEQQFVREIYERYESRARRAGVAVVNGLAFEVALGDWAAALAAEALREDTIDEVALYVGIEGFHPSRGTDQSAMEAMRRPGCVWSIDRWQPAVPGAETRMIDFGPPLGQRTVVSFPSGEIITVPRHVRARRVQSFISMFGDTPMQRGFARMTAVLGPVLPALMASPLGAFARSRPARTPHDPSNSERRQSKFVLVAEARSGFHRERVAISGGDIYGLGVQVMCMGVDALEGDAAPVGVRTPAELLAPRRALTTLADRCGLTIDESD